MCDSALRISRFVATPCVLDAPNDIGRRGCQLRAKLTNQRRHRWVACLHNGGIDRSPNPRGTFRGQLVAVVEPEEIKGNRM
jgi:hypothetical protein